MSKYRKQFALNNKENCKIYLCRIITSCELCAIKLKRYNQETKQILDKYSENDNIPFGLYDELCDKTSNIIGYLFNLLGDAQDSSISYFKYRNYISKLKKRGRNGDLDIEELSDEYTDILTQFNRKRNWFNHIPESLLVAEMDLVREGKASFPMDPIVYTHYNFVTYRYFVDMYNSNVATYEDSRVLIQAAKRDYKLLMGKSVEYSHVYIDTPKDIDNLEPSKISSMTQGIHIE